ncbi:DUF624 domain-containing protein [Pseudoflavonifractor sp. 60]|uniref:YesL family protein n=1 Tax=Pseudoflavonifractor sp. 60 TaxID=2304576 RepID=UPI00136FDDC3|nr:DUF624 domain-containing protein [Pseudoflavonifractor sp. 60]NBI68184.1 DUF624 domain-containing protein [Pseudoflavonifractor sp. 60]
MNGIFRYDSPVMEFFSRVADLMILNVITLVSMLPLVTVGAALTAMHRVLLDMVREREHHVVRSYFQTFRSNFKQATLLWGIMAAVGIGLFLDIRILRGGGLPGAVLTVILGAASFFWYLTFLYLFPLQAHFENRMRDTLKNALLMSIAAFPRTLGILAASSLPVLLVLLLDARCLPILFFLGAVGPGYLSALLYSPYLKRFEPDEE